MKAINYYDELNSYAIMLFNRNLKIFSQNLYKPIDFVHEAFLLGYEDVEAGKKIIRNQVLNEKRRLIAKIQQSENRSQFDVREKKCCKCKDIKPIDDFAPRIDNRTGLRYYNSYCEACERKRKRISFANSVQQHKSNRERQRRWRERTRLQKMTA